MEKERRKRILQKVGKGVKCFLLGAYFSVVGAAGYLSALIGIEYYATAKYPPLCRDESKSDPKKCREGVEEVFLEEKAKLGLLEKKIDLKFTLEENVARSWRKSDGYAIRLDMDCTLAELKHELYHIADGHCDIRYPNKFLFWTGYFLYAEPQAALYEAFDLKL